jgi:hypothetical protein
MRVSPYWPLIAALAELPWLGVIIIGTLYRHGKIPDDPDRHLDVVAAIPALIGLLIGIVLLATAWPERRVEQVCLIAGCLGCGLFVFSFGWEFFH